MTCFSIQLKIYHPNGLHFFKGVGGSTTNQLSHISQVARFLLARRSGLRKRGKREGRPWRIYWVTCLGGFEIVGLRLKGTRKRKRWVLTWSFHHIWGFLAPKLRSHWQIETDVGLFENGLYHQYTVYQYHIINIPQL